MQSILGITHVEPPLAFYQGFHIHIKSFLEPQHLSQTTSSAAFIGLIFLLMLMRGHSTTGRPVCLAVPSLKLSLYSVNKNTYKTCNTLYYNYDTGKFDMDVSARTLITLRSAFRQYKLD